MEFECVEFRSLRQRAQLVIHSVATKVLQLHAKEPTPIAALWISVVESMPWTLPVSPGFASAICVAGLRRLLDKNLLWLGQTIENTKRNPPEKPMTYLSENPWPLIFGLVAIAFISFLTASSRSGVIAIVCLLLSVGLFFLERYLVSPAEEVQTEIHHMLGHFKARNTQAISSQLSAANQNLRNVAERGIELVELSPSFHIRSAEVRLTNETTAVAHVRANGTVSLRIHSSGPRHVATFWRLTWKKEGTRWKLDDVKRLDVTSGKEVDYFSK